MTGYFALICLLVGAGFLYGALFVRKFNRRLRQVGFGVTGTIVDFHVDGEGYRFPIIQFINPRTGDQMEVPTNSSAKRSWLVGRPLSVFFDPERPTYASIDSPENARTPLMLGAIGGIDLLFGLLFVILSLR